MKPWDFREFLIPFYCTTQGINSAKCPPWRLVFVGFLIREGAPHDPVERAPDLGADLRGTWVALQTTCTAFGKSLNLDVLVLK